MPGILPGFGNGVVSEGATIRPMIPGSSITGTFPVVVYESSKEVGDLAASGTQTTLNPIVGVATGMVATGTMDVVTSGYIKNASWSWTTGNAIYVSATPGGLTQVIGGAAPTIVGYAISATEMSVGPVPPIALTALLDNMAGSAQGTVLYRGSSGWAGLAPASSGQFLQTLGAGSNPQWAGGASVSVITSGTYASRPSSPAGGQLYKCTDAPATLLYQSGAWQTYFQDMLVSPYVDAGFSWVNQGSTALTATGPFTYLQKSGTSTQSTTLKVKAKPTAPYTFTACIRPDNQNKFAVIGGICLYDSVSGKIKTFSLNGNGANTTTTAYSPLMVVNNLANTTTYSSTVLALPGPGMAIPIWLRISDNGTTVSYSYSMDGQNFQTFVSESNTSFLTPNSIGFVIDSDNNATPYQQVGMLILSSSL